MTPPPTTTRLFDLTHSKDRVGIENNLIIATEFPGRGGALSRLQSISTLPEKSRTRSPSFGSLRELCSHFKRCEAPNKVNFVSGEVLADFHLLGFDDHILRCMKFFTVRFSRNE